MQEKEPTSPIQPRSAESDLALIRQMMAAGRKRAGINGVHLVLWGALLCLTFFAQYAAFTGWIPHYHGELWVIMTVTGWAGSFYLGKKNGRSCAESNPALDAYGAAWMAVGITMLLFLVTTLLGGSGVGSRSATLLSSGVIGCSFFVMAMVLKMRPMFFAAFGWWGIMIYTIAAPKIGVEFLLVLSASAAFLILLPGLYLQHLAKTEE